MKRMSWVQGNSDERNDTVYVQTLKDGQVKTATCSSCYDWEMCRGNEWDIVVDEPRGTITVQSCPAEHISNIPDLFRAVVYLSMLSTGERLHLCEIRDVCDSSIEDISWCVDGLAERFGHNLIARALRRINSSAWEVTRGWSYCWIRNHADPETSELLRGMPMHKAAEG